MHKMMAGIRTDYQRLIRQSVNEGMAMGWPQAEITRTCKRLREGEREEIKALNLSISSNRRSGDGIKVGKEAL